MTDCELLDSYHETRAAYEAAKAGKGDRARAFTAFATAEQALASRMGRDVYAWPYRAPTVTPPAPR